MYKMLAFIFTLTATSVIAEVVSSTATVNPADPHAVSSPQISVPGISPKTASDFVEKQHAIIVDVREPSEVALVRIPGSINIPLSQLKNRLIELGKYKQTPIITQCRSGRRSQEAFKMLTSSGFAQVQNLEGGIVAWEKAGLKTEKKCC